MTLLSVPLDIYSKVGYLVVLYLNSWEKKLLYSIIVVPFYNSVTTAQGSQFLHILVNHCYFLGFLLVAILNNVKWYLIVDFISISLMVSDVEHLFICFLVICISCLEKCLFNFLDIFFFFRWFAFLLLICRSSLYILDTKLSLDIWFVSTCSLELIFKMFPFTALVEVFYVYILNSIFSILFLIVFFNGEEGKLF